MQIEKPVLNLTISGEKLRDLKILICQNKYEDLRLYLSNMGIKPGVSIKCAEARTLFIFALQSKKMCQILLNAGFSPNATTDEEIPSALWLAINNRSVNISTLLMENGADSHVFLKGQFDAIFCALYNIEVMKNEKNKRFFSYLVSMNHNDLITMKNPQGDTALFFLMRRIVGIGGIFNITKEAEKIIKSNIRFLVNKGANPFLSDKSGRTFMDLIEDKRKDIQLTSYLIEEMKENALYDIERTTDFVHELYSMQIAFEKESLNDKMKNADVKNHTLKIRI